jgi:branched-chain amino acid transport system ATP-binding protein
VSAGLSVRGVTAQRGELPVVKDVSLECPPGKVTVLLGANGAGKSTLLDAIAGVIGVADGTIAIDDVEIHRARRERRAQGGLAYVEQGRTIFPDLSAEDNLRVAARDDGEIESAFELFPELASRRAVDAHLLSGGEQQMLVLARGILARPRVLMIDEMSQGLAPVIVQRLLPFVQTAAEKGIAVLLVEQFAALALSIGDVAYVLTCGRIVLAEPCASLSNDPARLHAAYLLGAAAVAGPAGA